MDSNNAMRIGTLTAMMIWLHCLKFGELQSCNSGVYEVHLNTAGVNQQWG